MNIQLINRLENVRSFVVKNKDLFYVTTDLKISDNINFSLSDIASKYPGELFIIDYLLIWQDGRGRCAIYDLNKSSLLFSNSTDDKEFTFRRIDLLNYGFLVAKIYVNEIGQLCLFKIGDMTFEKIDYNITDALNDSHVLINVDLKEIERISLDGLKKWSATISDKYLDIYNEEKSAVFRQILGSYNNILWCSLSSGKLIGINQISGKFIHEIGYEESDFSIFPYEIKRNEYIPYGKAVQLDAYKGEIVGLRNNYFIRIDLNQFILKREYIFIKSMDEHKIESSFSSSIFPMDEKYIYFCDDRVGKIAIFDRHSLEVVWSYELDMAHDGIAQILEMEYADNRWYVLDRNYTLHVFEKQD